MPTGSLVAALLSFAVLAVIFVPLERAFPARRGQPVLRDALAIDALFFTGQYLFFSAVAVAFLSLVDSLVSPQVPGGLRAWIAARPLFVSATAALVLGDLLVYWFHRACHAFEPMWRFHAVHHSSEKLDWLAAHREHPFDGIGTQLCMNFPAIVMGIPVSAVAGLIVFRGVWAIFVHSNVRLPLGPLRMLLGAPELHHWHHAKVERTAHNFANLAPWLDWLFGTYHCPEGEETYPLGLDEPWPKGYFAQLAHPFVLTARALFRAAPRDFARRLPVEDSRG